MAFFHELCESRASAAWLKERYSAAAEPGEHLPSSVNAVQIQQWKTQEEQQQKLRQANDQLEADGFKPEDILLLTPFKVVRSEALQVLASERPHYAVRMFNVSAAKGLEALIVILVGVATNEWASSLKVEYVGCSRAKNMILMMIFGSEFKE